MFVTHLRLLNEDLPIGLVSLSSINGKGSIITAPSLPTCQDMRLSWWVGWVLASGGSSGSSIDPRFKRILWQLLAGTRGGPNRARILRSLSERPSNANQLATQLDLDYKTTQHHLKALILNGLVTSGEGSNYGALYFLSPDMEEGIEILDSIMAKLGHKKINGQSPGGHYT